MNEKTNAASVVRAAHTIQIDRRKRTVITGVMDVCSFHESEIVMKLENVHLVVTGHGLHIGKLLPDENRLDIDGQIDSLVYETPGALNGRNWFWRKKQV